MIKVEKLLNKCREYLPPDRLDLLVRACDFAAHAHQGQTRISGEPYIEHPLSAAETVADLQLDATAVAAAVLHDVLEDCDCTSEQLAERFGPDVARLVDGVTKLSRLNWIAPEERPGDEAIQAENLRKMFLAMAEDIRVVIIKLADRLHNMRTLDALPPEKRLRIARETIEIYAPLASRLGIWQLKWELEDLAFRHLQPERYEQISTLVASRRTERERYVEFIERELSQELERQGIQAEVQGRAKHIYSIHQKMERYAADGKSFNDIYDLVALRVLTDTVEQCYQTLGVVHGFWKPVPGQFDDYIAQPRESMYQSLHTTVMGPGHRSLEVQIRTRDMHYVAEYGVASHWRYKKEGSQADPKFEERLAWLRQLLEWQRDLSGAEDFVESVKTDIFRDQVFVYTPKGEVKDLPAGATPLDFAYRVHTDLGHRCVGAKVNGRLVPLSHQLANGDVVEIMSGRNSRGPSLDWLNPNLGYIKTSNARERIRAWFKKQHRSENIERGRESLEHELKRLGISLPQWQDELLRLFKFEALDDFLATVGHGEVSAQHVAIRAANLQRQRELEAEAVEHPLTPSAPKASRITHSVQVLGAGDVLTSLGPCCNPLPGDAIIGYVTRLRGVSVHRVDCSNLLHASEPERLLQVEWGRDGTFYAVSVRMEAWDRVGLLRDISNIVAEEKINMVGVRTQEHTDHTTSVLLTLETTGIEQLTRVLNKLEGVRGTLSVSRWSEGA